MSAYLCVENMRVCASVLVCGQRASAQRTCVCLCATSVCATVCAEYVCLRVGVGFQRLACQQGVINLWKVSVSMWWLGGFAQLSSC